MLTAPYRDLGNDTVQVSNYNVYGYSISLEAGKTVSEIGLPTNGNVIILAMSLR